MNGNTRLHDIARRSRSTPATMAIASLTLLLAGHANSQVPVDENGNPFSDDFAPLDNGVQVENPTLTGAALLSDGELETLVGPIALYPDDLLAIVLPASTYPLEIVQAARFVERAAEDSTLKPDEEWDDSIVALLNYPDVLNMMNEDIDWTWKLGEAVVDQQTDVITAIESFRDQAYAAGNLKSDEYQTVSVDDGIIEIEPVNEDVIYVPYYEPARVIAYAPQPVYHYYPRAYPVYYYPYASDYYFGPRPFWGVTTAFTIGWATDRLHVYHHSYNGHPYFGRNYFGSYWRRPSINVYNNYYVNPYRYRARNHYRVGDYWRPRHRSGPRPRSRVTSSGYYDRDRDHRRNQRSERNYRDQRTNGLVRNRGDADRTRQNGATRAGNRLDGRADNRANNRASNRANNRANNRSNGFRASDDRGRNSGNNTNRTGRSSENRDAIRFRPRGDGAYNPTRNQRVQRTRENDAVRNTKRARQPGTTRRSADANRVRTTNNAQNRNVRRQESNVNRVRTSNRQAGFAGNRNASKRGEGVTRGNRTNASAGARTNTRAVQTRRNNPAVRNTTTRQRTETRPRQNRAAAPNRRQAVSSQPSRPRNNAERTNRRAGQSEKRARPSQNRQSKRSGNGRRSGRPDRK